MQENLSLAECVFLHVYLPIARFWQTLSQTARFLTLNFLHQITANVLQIAFKIVIFHQNAVFVKI